VVERYQVNIVITLLLDLTVNYLRITFTKIQYSTLTEARGGAVG
jgi:hypothetical protein